MEGAGGRQQARVDAEEGAKRGSAAAAACGCGGGGLERGGGARGEEGGRRHGAARACGFCGRKEERGLETEPRRRGRDGTAAGGGVGGVRPGGAYAREEACGVTGLGVAALPLSMGKTSSERFPVQLVSVRVEGLCAWAGC